MAIITMSRQMGTGAYQIAKDVAKKLKYTIVDGPKIAELAPKYGVPSEIIRRVDEKPPVYNTVEDRLQASYLNTLELIILDLAKKGNVIIYGRGGQDLLRGMHGILRVRFIAPFDERVENFAEREWIDPDLARELIRKNDHQRGGFIHFYFDRDWNDPLGYDLVFNTSRLSSASIVESIVAAARDPRLRQSEQETAGLLDEIILCKRVETDLLKSGEITSPHFHIESRRGTVNLSGHVYTDEERETALKLITKVSGVKRVEESLQVMNYKPYKE